MKYLHLLFLPFVIGACTKEKTEFDPRQDVVGSCYTFTIIHESNSSAGPPIIDTIVTTGIVKYYEETDNANYTISGLFATDDRPEERLTINYMDDIAVAPILLNNYSFETMDISYGFSFYFAGTCTKNTISFVQTYGGNGNSSTHKVKGVKIN